jgi:uncharacterized protein
MTDHKNNAKTAMALCVICHAHPQTEKYRPFCSKRCADVDLHRWLGGVYAIPALPDEEEDGVPVGPDEAGAEGRKTG